ncbi:adenosylcobinamide-phosphate synthase CbiB [Desulfococcus sp.]|uniref:adenosylcobinamide-phosphate synthase CbiB n=1 Tax=Desulfococcus sp. TaxID=2025834 RepID=UPI0035940DA8
MTLSAEWLVLPAAFLLDFFIGDPQFAHHPVRCMGRAIEFFEPRFRKLPVPPTVSGGLFALSLILGTWALVALMFGAACVISPEFQILLEIIALYFCIAARGLSAAAGEIYGILRQGDLAAARSALSMIVGRETDRLSDAGVARAAVETVAENLVDGFIAPLFFFLLGGVPLAAAYKMVNTLDSMVGYKNDAYREFGKVSARIDDAANYLPARLSAPVIALAAQLLNRRGIPAFRMAANEGRRHSSPNAGWAEAAFAGALRVKLGGPNVYHGRVVDKPYIGGAFGDVTAKDIPRACDLLELSAFLWFVIIWYAGMFSRAWGG